MLADSFPKHGLVLLDYKRLGPTDLVRKAGTDNWMLALEEVGFIIIARGGSAGSPISSKEYSDLLSKASTEVQQGVNIWIDMQVVLGQK